MKKTPLIVIVIALLLGAGWYLWSHRSAVMVQPQQSILPTPQPVSDTVPMPPVEEKTGVISSIKEAMGLGKKMECTYADVSGSNVSMSIFIDGKKTKTVTKVGDEMMMYGLFDGETQYSWTTGTTKQGFKMDKLCMDEMKDLSGNLPKSAKPAPITPGTEAMDALQNISCKPAESEDFSIPSDITFVDQCEMLRSNMKVLNQIKQGLPEGAPTPVQY